MPFIISVIILALLISYASGFLFYRLLLRASVVDKPNERSSHQVVTVRGGGVAILLPLLLMTGYVVWPSQDVTSIGFLIAIIGIAGISVVDDIKSLSAKVRLVGHAVAGLLLLWSVHSGDSGEVFGNMGIGWILALGVVLLVWLVGYANAYNFMDGINGLAAGQAAITSIFSAYAIGSVTGNWDSGPVLICLALTGAALGFLPHNVPRASMFMGDIGSVTLGFVFAAISVWSVIVVGWELFLPLCLIHSNFVLDTGITLFVRIRRKEKWWKPHREHFYQKLIRAGKSHSFVTFWEMFLQFCILFILVRSFSAGNTERMLLYASVFVIWIGFFFYCEKCFHAGAQISTNQN
ncbi:glycosyltransferase family 4 protein [Verrucomicrobia bacterium]|nr:glycosyltransferase family 4 protein [Verrucomicrobiota bacterium]